MRPIIGHTRKIPDIRINTTNRQHPQKEYDSIHQHNIRPGKRRRGQKERERKQPMNPQNATKQKPHRKSEQNRT